MAQRGSRGQPPTAPLAARTNDKRVVLTLLVPYTIGSKLKEEMQEVVNEFVALIGGDRVCMVKQSGNTLLNLLGCNGKWAAAHSSGDPVCAPPGCDIGTRGRSLERRARSSSRP